jgi:nucleoside-diphosphate-sugar epimerase
VNLPILGGRAFLGRPLAAAALARGDEVVPFRRGRTGRGLFLEAEHVLGDRDPAGGSDGLPGIEALDGRGYRTSLP